MNVSVYYSVIFFCFLFKPCFIHGNNLKGCISRNYSEILPRIAPLTGSSFQVEKEGFLYTVGICSNVTSGLNASVTQQRTGDQVQKTVIGRRNDTEIVIGSSSILLTYGSGDEVKDPCSGPGHVEIIITCSNIPKATLSLRDISAHHGGCKGCTFIFDLVTPPFENCTVVEIIKPPGDKGLSNGSVFSIIFLTTFGVYFVIGICYRRLVKGAKGFEQIPHSNFWKKLGNLLADGCDFACRHGDRREESWQRLTNNFNDSHDDEDDALLQP